MFDNNLIHPASRLNEAIWGITKSGVLFGFDIVPVSGALTLNVNHTATGEQRTLVNVNGTITTSPKLGGFVTNEGYIRIVENTYSNISVPFNSSGDQATHLLCVNHQTNYNLTEFTTLVVLYPNTTTPPNGTSIPIATIATKPNATSLDTAIITRFPNVGLKNAATVSGGNSFTGTNTFEAVNYLKGVAEFSNDNNGFRNITLSGNYNFYTITAPALSGTTVRLKGIEEGEGVVVADRMVYIVSDTAILLSSGGGDTTNIHTDGTYFIPANKLFCLVYSTEMDKYVFNNNFYNALAVQPPTVIDGNYRIDASLGLNRYQIDVAAYNTISGFLNSPYFVLGNTEGVEFEIIVKKATFDNPLSLNKVGGSTTTYKTFANNYKITSDGIYKMFLINDYIYLNATTSIYTPFTPTITYSSPAFQPTATYPIALTIKDNRLFIRGSFEYTTSTSDTTITLMIISDIGQRINSNRHIELKHHTYVGTLDLTDNKIYCKVSATSLNVYYVIGNSHSGTKVLTIDDVIDLD